LIGIEAMISKLGFSKFKIPLLLIYLIPFIVLLWFIDSFGVNVPYWDEWNLVDLFERFATGKTNFGDFFAPENEHRIVFPKIIFITLAFISKWDIRYEFYFSIFLATITFLSMYKLSYLQGDNKHNIPRHLTNILTCILIFSLVQYQNWLWGFQLAWLLINACLVIAVLLIALSKNHSKRLYFAAIPCFIASFSLAHGLLTWLAVIPSIASLNGNSRQRKTRILLWILLFAVTCIIYFIGYRKPSDSPSTLFFLHKPFVALGYFFTLLGTPLVHQSIISPIIGMILFSIFSFLIYQSIKKSEPKFKLDPVIVPWISIGLFALLFAIITALGRAGFGVEQGMSSRYTTSSVLLIVSTAHLLRLFPLVNSFFACTIAFLLIINSVNVIPQAGLFRLQRQVDTTCLDLVNFIDESPDSCLADLYPSSSRVRELAGILERLGFRKFPKDIAFITKPVGVYGYIDSPPTVGTPYILSKSESVNPGGWTIQPDGHVVPPPLGGPPCTLSECGSVNAAGWAILPDRREMPKTVLFSYGSNRSFFANAVVDLDSPDVVMVLHSGRYKKVRWSVNLSPKSLPLGETVIKAWVYDPYAKQLVKLNGEPKVKVVE